MTADCKYLNKTFVFHCEDGAATIDNILQQVVHHAPSPSHHPIRFAVFKTTPEAVHVECSYSVFGKDLSNNARPPWHPKRAIVAHVVPTSVGAAVGGFAGDASPATRLLAEVSELLITNPNAVNASDILSITPNTLYVEGGLLDQFFLGACALRRVAFNHVGVIIEKQPQKYIDSVRYSIDAASATCGIPIVGYAVSPRKIGPRVKRFPSGAYTGTLDDPAALLESAQHLIAQGASALAITSEVLDLPDLTRYVEGLEPNPHGAVEALISHTVTAMCGVPSAHAPMWGEAAGDDSPMFERYDPREGAELVTTTAIGCVLQGLHKAPQPVTQSAAAGDISIGDLLAIILPAGAVGSIPALCCDKLGIPVIGVIENTTLHDVRPEELRLHHYIRAENYLEAAGLIAALRAGIAIDSTRRPLAHVRRIL